MGRSGSCQTLPAWNAARCPVAAPSSDHGTATSSTARAAGREACAPSRGTPRDRDRRRRGGGPATRRSGCARRRSRSAASAGAVRRRSSARVRVRGVDGVLDHAARRSSRTPPPRASQVSGRARPRRRRRAWAPCPCVASHSPAATAASPCRARSAGAGGPPRRRARPAVAQNHQQMRRPRRTNREKAGSPAHSIHPLGFLSCQWPRVARATCSSSGVPRTSSASGPCSGSSSSARAGARPGSR